MGSGKSEVESRKSEVRSGKWEVGSPSSAFVELSFVVPFYSHDYYVFCGTKFMFFFCL